MATTIIKSYNSDNQAIVDDTGHLLVSGTVNATNPSVGTTGALAPTSATEAGGVDNSGNLQPFKIDSSGALVTSSVATPEGFSVITPGYPVQITVTGISSVILPANPLRKYAHIINNSSDAIFIQFKIAAALNAGIKIGSGGLFFISGNDLWLGDVTAIATTSSQIIDVLEGEQ